MDVAATTAPTVSLDKMTSVVTSTSVTYQTPGVGLRVFLVSASLTLSSLRSGYHHFTCARESRSLAQGSLAQVRGKAQSRLFLKFL